MNSPLRLSAQTPFAKGGNRLCFLHPEDAGKCIKVDRPDRTPEHRRRRKPFPTNLRPARCFDDNLEEHHVIQELETRHGQQIYQHIPHQYGWLETDLGRGLIIELIRDPDGRVSETLESMVWREGITESIREAVHILEEFWIRHGVLSRALLPHNVVAQVQEDPLPPRLTVVDGLGRSELLPFAQWFRFAAVRKARRKTRILRERMDRLVERKKIGDIPNRIGYLNRDV